MTRFIFFVLFFVCYLYTLGMKNVMYIAIVLSHNFETFHTTRILFVILCKSTTNHFIFSFCVCVRLVFWFVQFGSMVLKMDGKKYRLEWMEENWLMFLVHKNASRKKNDIDNLQWINRLFKHLKTRQWEKNGCLRAQNTWFHPIH